MTLRTVCKELVRTPVRTLLFLVLLVLATALLVLGVNLYASCQAAREQVSDTYKTVGTIRQKPDSAREADQEGTASFMSSLSWYDPDALYTVVLPDGLFDGLPTMLPVENRPSVFSTAAYVPSVGKGQGKTADLRTPARVNAYRIVTFRVLEDADTEDEEFMARFDQVRSYGWVNFAVPVEMLSINGEACENPLKATLQWPIMESGEPVVLRQGVEYIAALSYYYDSYAGGYTCEPVRLSKAVALQKGGVELEYAGGIVYEVDEGFEGSEAARQLEDELDACRRLADMADRAFITVPTRSLDLLDPFYQDRVLIRSGRRITEEEFESGAKVCMISKDFLDVNDPDNPDYINLVRVGDKLSLTWYGAMYGAPAEISPDTGMLSAPQTGGSYEPAGGGEYEIVGVYSTDMQGMDYQTGGFTNLGAMEVIVPSTSFDFDSLPILSGGPLSQGACSFQLENGKGEPFLKAVEGLEYSELLQVTLNDQGYTAVAKGLDAISLLAVILLLAGGASALCLLLFFVYLQIARREREAAILLSLGAGRRRGAAFLLLSVLLVAAVGIAAGTLLGHAVTDRVSAQVYAQAKESGFSREYSDQFEASRDVDFAYDGRARWPRSLGAGLAALGAAAALSAAFTAAALGREPLELLTRKD